MTTTVLKGSVTLASDAGATLNVNGDGIKTNTITSITSATALNIGNEARALGGNINIGCGGISGSGGSTTGILIGAGANTTANSYLSLGSESMGYTYFRSANININDTATSGNVSIGNSGNAGTITLSKPITPNYLPSTITSTQIGFTVNETITVSGNWASGTFTNLFSAITLPAGVWMVSYSIRFLSASTSTLGDIFVYGEDSVTVTTPPLAIAGNSATQIITTSGIAFTGSFPVVSSGTTTYNIAGVVNYSGGGVFVQLGTQYGSSVRRTRIA